MTEINILVDKAVDGRVDGPQKLSIIDGFELFAWIVGNVISE